MVKTYQTTGGNLVAVVEVPREQTHRYGVLDVVDDDGRIAKARGLIEESEPAVAPSTLTIIGHYIIQPEIFSHLGKLKPGGSIEIQLTDGLQRLIRPNCPFCRTMSAGSAQWHGRQPRRFFSAEGTRRQACNAIVAELVEQISAQTAGARGRDGVSQCLASHE